jgi:hypothetical protein
MLKLKKKKIICDIRKKIFPELRCLRIIGVIFAYNTKFKEKNVACLLFISWQNMIQGSRVRFPGTTKKSSGSGTGSSQPREYN